MRSREGATEGRRVQGGATQPFQGQTAAPRALSAKPHLKPCHSYPCPGHTLRFRLSPSPHAPRPTPPTSRQQGPHLHPKPSSGILLQKGPQNMLKGSLLSMNPSLQLPPPLPTWRRDSAAMQIPREFESEIKTPHALWSSCPRPHPSVVSLPACHIRCGVSWRRAATQPASSTRKLSDTLP